MAVETGRIPARQTPPDHPWMMEGCDAADHFGSAWRLEAAAEIPPRWFVAESWTAGVAS